MNNQRTAPSSPSSNPSRPRWPLVCVAAYWCVLFLATHWPNPFPPGGTPKYPDKLVHFTAYAGLALLGVLALARAPAGTRRRVSGWRSMGVLALVVGYGLFDEITQPVTGRDFEWLDWAADCAGATTGTILSILWHSRRARVGRPS